MFGTRYKPSSVRHICGAPIIYLGRQSLAASSNLPPDIGRATLNCRYTRSCNPRDAQPRSIATLAVGSYPAFSPLPPKRRLFSSTLLYPLRYQAVNLRGALCCSDFPLTHKVSAIERVCGGKDSIILRSHKIKVKSNKKTPNKRHKVAHSEYL